MAANPRLVTIDAAGATVTVGTQIMSGFGDDAIEITFVEDQWADSVGADGEVVHINKNDKRADFKMTFQPTSKSLAYLTTLLATDSVAGAGLVPISVVAPSQGLVASTDAARCFRVPGFKISKGVNQVVYTFRAGMATIAAVGVQ